jgi:hypothetical protein
MSTLPAGTPAATNEAALLDRRRTFRLELDQGVTCHLIASVGDTSWPARVLDLSTRGVRLMLRRRFEEGAHVVVELANGLKMYSHAVSMRVTHVARDADGAYFIGGEFERRLTHDELMALVA